MNFLASSKYVGRVLAILTAITGLFLITGCGSGNSGIATPNKSGFSAGSLNGTYVIAVSGTDVTTTLTTNTIAFFAIAGTITADGNGHITGGTVDINDLNLGSQGVYTAQAVSASTYSLSQDGRGKANLTTPQGTFGFDFVLTSTSHGLITRFDNNGSGSGTLDLQSSGGASQSSLTSLAFSLSGADYTVNLSSGGLASLGAVGAVTLNSTGTVTSGTEDFNDNGDSVQSSLTGLPISAGSVSLTSSTAGTASLTTSASFSTQTFDVWVIDSTHLKLIETDTASSGFALAGDAFTQSGITAGPLVFTLAGENSTYAVVAGGFATTDANGNLSGGTEDYDELNTNNLAPGTVSFTAASTTSVNAPGRYQIATTAFSNGVSSNLAFAAYPYNGGIFLLEDDSVGSLQGAAYPQTATSFAASAGYGLNLSGENPNGEVDDIAQFNAGNPGTSTSTVANLTGALDENNLGLLSYDAVLSGLYVPDSPATGRGSIGVPSINTQLGALDLEYYVASDNTVVFIEDDGEQIATGMFQLQSSSSSSAAAQSHMVLVHAIAARSSHATAIKKHAK
jgi:hypothetical protein